MEKRKEKKGKKGEKIERKAEKGKKFTLVSFGPKAHDSHVNSIKHFFVNLGFGFIDLFNLFIWNCIL
jgi:hypothetical protein